MERVLNIAVAQLNPTVGDVAGNLALVRQALQSVPDADLLLTTELVVRAIRPKT